VEKGKLQELAGFPGELTDLPPCPESVCIKTLDSKIDYQREEEKKN
jgi:hypothetical protein